VGFKSCLSFNFQYFSKCANESTSDYRVSLCIRNLTSKMRAISPGKVLGAPLSEEKDLSCSREPKVERGQNELLKYYHNISSNRPLILKILFILVFFVIFFIVFIA